MSRARPTSETAPRTSPGQLAHVREQAARGSAGRGRGAGHVHRVHDGGGERQRPQSVGQGVVELEEHGEGDAVLARQHMRLPRRPAALQRALHEPARHRVEVGGRGVQPDVVEGVEVGGGFAGGAAEGERPAGRAAATRRGSASAVRARAAARAASRSAAWAPAVGEWAAKTPSAPRCIGCSADSMFQNARSRGASRSEVNGLPRVDDGWASSQSPAGDYGQVRSSYAQLTAD